MVKASDRRTYSVIGYAKVKTVEGVYEGCVSFETEHKTKSKGYFQDLRNALDKLDGCSSHKYDFIEYMELMVEQDGIRLWNWAEEGCDVCTIKAHEWKAMFDE